MPFLDVVRLFFEPTATIEDEASIFGREWQMTLRYVLNQPGVTCTSRLTAQNELWVFLTWKTEDDRCDFYNETAGFGFMSNYMTKPPSVFFFGDSSYEELDKTNTWTVDIISAGPRHGRDPWHARDLKRKIEMHEQQALKSLSRHNFMARQKRIRPVFKNLYEGNDFDDAFIGLTQTNGCKDEDVDCGLQWERHSIELQRHQQNAYPTSAYVEPPLDIADLTMKKPWEYGVLSSDESEYSDTAYPMSLTFRPMSTIHMADEFLPESRHEEIADTAATNEYAMCVVSVPIDSTYVEQCSEGLIEDLRKKVKLQDGTEGLRELSILRAIAREDANQVVRFLCVWTTASDRMQWWQQHLGDETTKPSNFSCGCSYDYKWTSDTIGLPQLIWEELPLTRDNKSWQALHKVLEIVEFVFDRNQTPEEKKAFLGRLYALINTMSSCWAGDMEDRPVVFAEDPVWTDSDDLPSSCLLFLAWDGSEQQAAWLRNFVAHSFTWTGHIAHTLGLACRSVKSGTYSMEKLYEWHPESDTPPDVEDWNVEGEDSDRDMGF